jgi:hypothetical protein
MANENPWSDLVYEFWRWEYLRRNKDYQQKYDIMATRLNALGVTGFKDIKIDGNTEISVFDCLCTDKAIPPEYNLEIFYWLYGIMDRFKVFPPPGPDHGITSNELLKKILTNDLVLRYCDDSSQKEGLINYENLPRGNHIPFPFSTVIKESDHKLTEQELPESLRSANQRFLKQNPRINSLAGIEQSYLDQIQSFLEEHTEKKGNYEILSGMPKPIINKDKKMVNATDQFLKSGQIPEYVKLQEAIRNQRKAYLKNDGKRIKRQKGYLPRAIGLFLWDQQKEQGDLNPDIISNFFDKLESMIEDIMDNFDIPAEPEEFLSETGRKQVIDTGREFSRLVRHTDKCIQNMDVLPIT